MDAKELLNNQLLLDVLGYVEDYGPADVWSSAKMWMDLRDEVLGEQDRDEAEVNNQPLCEPTFRESAGDTMADLIEMLELLTVKGTKQATGLGWNERLRMARDLIRKVKGTAK